MTMTASLVVTLSVIVALFVHFHVAHGQESREPPLPWTEGANKAPCCSVGSLYPMVPRFPPPSDYKYERPKLALGSDYTILNLNRKEMAAIKSKHFIVKWKPHAVTETMKTHMKPGHKFPWNTKFVIKGPHCPPYHEQPCCKLKVFRQTCCRPCKIPMPQTGHDPGILKKKNKKANAKIAKRIKCGTYFQQGFVCPHPLRPTPMLASSCDMGRGSRACKDVCCKPAVEETVRKFKCFKWFQMSKKRSCKKGHVRKRSAVLKQCTPFGGKKACARVCCRKKKHTCRMYFKTNKCMRGTVKRRKVRHLPCKLSGKGKKSCRNQCCRLKRHRKLQNKVKKINNKRPPSKKPRPPRKPSRSRPSPPKKRQNKIDPAARHQRRNK